MTDISFSAWMSIQATVGPEHRNANGQVAIGYHGALSERFLWVHPDDAEPYLVFSDSRRDTRSAPGAAPSRRTRLGPPGGRPSATIPMAHYSWRSTSMAKSSSAS